MEPSEVHTEGGNGQDIRQMAAARFDDVREWSGEILGRVETFVRERPGTAVLIALGAGFLVGRLVRRS